MAEAGGVAAAEMGLGRGRARPGGWVHRLALVVLAAVPFVATMIATAHGPGVSPDSIGYLSAATSLAGGRGLVVFSGEQLTIFPPGLPVLLAFGHLVGASPDSVARVVNAGAFSATAILGYVLLRRHVRSSALVFGGAAFLAISVCLLQIADMAWSEPLFVVVVLLLVVVLEVALERPDKRWVLVAGALVWVAFMLRYSGLSLIPAGGLVLLIGGWGEDKRLAIRDALVFGAVASIAPVLWMLRNRGVDGSLMGPRSASTRSLPAIARATVATLGRWIVPATPALVVLAVLVVVVATAMIALRGRALSFERTGVSHTLVPLVVVSVVYAVYVLCAELVTNLDPVDSRLLSPLFVPLVVLSLVALELLLAATSPAAGRFVLVGLMAVLALQAASLPRAVATGARGRGYASRSVRESELIAAVDSLPVDAVVYSNNTSAIWARTRRELIVSSEELAPTPATEEVQTARPHRPDAGCGGTYLAWFDSSSPGLRSPEELASVVETSAVSRVSDGTLFEVGRGDRPATCD